jgi:hypothetical protein
MTSHRIATTRERPTLGDFKTQSEPKSGAPSTRPAPRKPAANPLRSQPGHRGPRSAPVGPLAAGVGAAEATLVPGDDPAPAALPANENAARPVKTPAASISPYRDIIERTQASQAYADVVGRRIKSSRP